MNNAETKITMLSVAILHPHRDNPRKALGDLTELSDSIKANGVMQNLTVIPVEEAEPDKHDGYTVIIGHRRLEAAKMAGLGEVPCIITHMDRAKQLSTMLLENIQRNDLTVSEQAQGFQLMMDMGSTVKEISTLSGFSETTVRHRLEIAKLDSEKLKAVSEERQISLSDFAKLEQIDDMKKRNKLLESIGTPNFAWNIQRAVTEQNAKKLEALAKPKLMQFAEKKESYECYNFDKIARLTDESSVREFDVPEAKKGEKYFYTVAGCGVEIFVKKPSKKKDVDKKAKEKHKARQQARVAALDELAERCFESRKRFILEFDAISVSYQTVFAFITDVVLSPEYSGTFNRNIIREIINGDEDPYRPLSTEERKAFSESCSERKKAIIAAYARIDSEVEKVHDYNGVHRNAGYCSELMRLYEALAILGYKQSDEEREYLTGTHKAYRI